MDNFKRIAFAVVLFGAVAGSNAQSSATVKKQFVFSAIKGTISKPDSLSLPVTVTSVKLAKGNMTSFKIIPRQKGKLVVVFAPAANFTGLTNAKIEARNSSGKLVVEINLTGLSTNGLEGENEAPLALVINALGYKANIGWTSLANHARPELQGEEVSSALFRKAGKGKIEIIPVARYSPDFELPFGYYINNAAAPAKHQVGVLAKAGTFPEHQTLFPAISNGTNSFDPGERVFGFYATSPSHSAYSEDVWNMLFFPANAVHATRIYPLKSAEGKLLPNTYLLCFEEAKNGDYNDYVFLVKNIVPVAKDPFISLFNGKDLNGWHTFLKDFGTNKDPNNNFQIKDGSMYMVGKDLGYAITEKGYTNYHFKVDFKFGEKRWPPREQAKRDGGICYNIPMNEPDSIWPKSIECQIQEGDTGDFWLLGFSTINVNGKQNVPANHTRFVKQADGEKPRQWNTVEVISVNGKCVHIVNSVIVNVGDEASVKNGRILLQSEYSEIYYRNVKIREL
ncbi:MAG: DUF1080 domain-containing protein [Chitinophagaceae bacterium]